MSRTMTSPAATQALARVDVEPVIILKIIGIFANNVAYYFSDRNISDFTTLLQAEGRIITVSDIIQKLINRKSASAQSITIELTDIPTDLRNALETRQFQNLSASIYQHFIGTIFPTDNVLLYSGVIASPVLYDEIQRKLTFDIIPPIKSFQVPFSPLEDLVTTTTDAHSSTEKKFRGRPWPLPFGDVVDSPCQQVAEGPLVKTIAAVYSYNTGTFITECEVESDPNPFNNPTTVNNYFLNDELIRGAFTTSTSKIFSITARNQVILTANTPSTRPNAGTDPDSALANVLYVVGSNNANGITVYPQLVGLWITPTAPAAKVAGAVQNYCIKQVGNKCFFLTAWARTSTGSWLVGGTNGTSGADGQITLQARRYSTVTGTTWQHSAGAILQKDQNRDKVYIGSDNAHTGTGTSNNDVFRVRAYRQVPIGDVNSGETIRQLVTVPRSYYVINPNNSNYRHTLADGTVRDPLTVTFDLPLSRRNQGWEDDIVYITIRTSSRNTSDALKYLIEKYSLLTCDSSSFAAVATALANYPSDFVLLESQDALQVAIDIAWQARCSILTIGNIVKLKYLSIAEPTTGDGNITIGNDHVILDEGTVINESEFEDRVTVFVADFNYSNAESAPRRVIKRVNTTLLGEKIEHFSFYIYSNQGLVDISATWWSQRYGRVWRKLSISGPLPLLTFESFDFASVTLTGVMGYTAMKTIVESIQHDTFNSKITLNLWTPVESGSNAASSFGWLPAGTPTTAMTTSPFSAINANITDNLVATAASQDGN